jgi:S-DNA-T family DNA segregation ATPase FtsK/SpoIIIE
VGREVGTLMKNTAVHVDWSGKHGPVWGTINVALGLAAVAAAMSNIAMPGYMMALGGAVAMLVAMATAMARLMSGKPISVAFASGSVIAAGGLWILVARTGDGILYSGAALVIVAACVAIAGRAWVRSKEAHQATAVHVEAVAGTPVRVRVGGPLAHEWEQRIQRVCKKQGVVMALDRWPTENGFTLAWEPVAGGTTVNDISTMADRLASDARLPEGCGVEVGPGAHRGQLVLKVSIKDGLASELPFPADLSLRSVNDPIAVGGHRDGTTSTVHLRYHSLALVGQIDSGKTNRLHVVIGGLARCDDVLTWGIDLTGGLYQPWITPWLEGRAAAPGIDWAAGENGDVEEVDQMCDAAIDIINGRKPSYRARMRAANVDKLPVGPDVPQIVIVVDELKTLPKEIQKKLATISDTGRSAGVRLVVCALRATVDYLPMELNAQSKNKIGMLMRTESEIAYLVGWEHNLKPADMPHPGCGCVISADKPTECRPDRAFRITPAGVDAVVVATGNRRPQLDKPSARMANMGNSVYTDRWDRFTSRQAALLQETEDIVTDGHAKVMAAIEEKRAADTARSQYKAGPLSDPRTWPTPKNVAYDRSPPHDRMLTMLREAQPDGFQPGELHNRLVSDGFTGLARQTVMTWLALEVSRGTCRQPVARGRYYAVVHEAVSAE